MTSEAQMWEYRENANDAKGFSTVFLTTKLNFSWNFSSGYFFIKIRLISGLA